MALVKCHECGNQVSDTAKTCPSCGAKVQRKSKKSGISPQGKVVFFLAFIVLLGVGQITKKENRQQVATSTQIENEAIKARDLERNPHGIRPKQSGWDGSYREVKDYLKLTAHDPDSIKIESCTEAYKAEDGWDVGCSWRGKNAFGGLVLQSARFVIRNGQVVRMH